jgi:hypothetical protein
MALLGGLLFHDYYLRLIAATWVPTRQLHPNAALL